MSESEKIDFGALDPTRDARRWEQMVSSVVERARVPISAPSPISRRPRSIPLQLVSWARPTLAIAASLALVVWIGALFARPAQGQPAELTQAMSQWLVKGDLSASEQLIQEMGDAYGYR